MIEPFQALFEHPPLIDSGCSDIHAQPFLPNAQKHVSDALGRPRPLLVGTVVLA